ncbi:PLP-dependent transferase [Ensifer sp. ENS12]|nr:PLP-dependent transferase [Ensifer sp. ENS12]
MSDKADSSTRQGLNTRLVRSGFDPSSQSGFVNPSVVHGSTVLFPDARTMETHGQKYTYATRGTPTTDALCDAINELEGAAILRFWHDARRRQRG